MDGRRPHLVLVPGGRAGEPDAAPPGRHGLHVVRGDYATELESALADAVEAARQMRLEIERRIARALEAFEDRG